MYTAFMPCTPGANLQCGRRVSTTHSPAQPFRARYGWRPFVFLPALVLFAGCTVGPKYHTPTVQTPPAYKEIPTGTTQTGLWKVAQPSDNLPHDKWWEMYNDAELNGLESQVNANNQTIAAAYENFMAARALVRQARSQYFPTASTAPAITKSRQINIGGTTSGSGATGTSSSSTSSSREFTEYTLPGDASWVPDLFGKVRNTVRSNAYAAQASAADLENTRLAIHSEVAMDYYQLRQEDALKQLLDSTVIAYQESLKLTQALYDTGIDSDESVAQAETQLESAEALDTNLGIQRSQLEHAIAMLVGQPASTFSIPAAALNVNPPAIPVGVPSELLERRPDIAADERLVAQANAQIGIAKAAYYPTVTLSGSFGFGSTSAADWFTWPSRIWSVGPSLAETIFDAGLRRATVQQFEANYLATVANYRQSVLTAFQQVEDYLASMRILALEIQQQETAVRSAERNLSLATERYRLGIDPYLNVITAQTTLLSNQETLVTLQSQLMTSSVQLIEALGGGWSTSDLPSTKDVASKTAPPAAPATNQ